MAHNNNNKANKQALAQVNVFSSGQQCSYCHRTNHDTKNCWHAPHNKMFRGKPLLYMDFVGPFQRGGNRANKPKGKKWNNNKDPNNKWNNNNKNIKTINTGILMGIIHVTNTIVVVVADMLLTIVVVVVEVGAEAEVGDITAALDLNIIIKIINTVMLTQLREANRVTKQINRTLFRLNLNSLNTINNISNLNRMLLRRQRCEIS